jgi:hypothetical protein
MTNMQHVNKKHAAAIYNEVNIILHVLYTFIP